MQKSWKAFIKTGDPSYPGHEWKPYNGIQLHMEIENDATVSIRDTTLDRVVKKISDLDSDIFQNLYFRLWLLEMMNFSISMFSRIWIFCNLLTRVVFRHVLPPPRMHHQPTIVKPFVFLAQKIIMARLEHITSLVLSMVKIRLVLKFISYYTQYHTEYHT